MKTILILAVLLAAALICDRLAKCKCGPSVWLERWMVERDLDD